MKAAVVARAGAVPEYGDFDEPIVDGDQQLVELVASGIHTLVRSLASGRHYGSSGIWPQIPGVDAVARTATGDLVYTGYVRAPFGTLAERMAVPPGGLVLPAGADPAQVAGGVNPGLSSWLPLQRRLAEIGSLETVLVLGVTGTAGYIAVQNALALGAKRVIGLGRDAGRLTRAQQAGAETAPLPTDSSEAVTAAVATALDGAAPTLILDYLWGNVAEATWDALSSRGVRGLGDDTADISHVQIGALAGPRASLPSSLLRSRRIRISGNGAGSVPVAEIVARLPGYLQLIADGRVTVPVRTHPLSQIAAAWEAAPASDARTVIVPG